MAMSPCNRVGRAGLAEESVVSSNTFDLYRSLVAIVLPALAWAACTSDRATESLIGDASPEAELVLEWAIGDRIDASEEYQFASIGSLLPTVDGTVWVADGTDLGQTPLIREFDYDGSFIRQVGRQGMGPGEYLAPQGLAQLQDGRVVVRDARIPSRLTVYNPDGSLAETWPLGSNYYWPNGGGGSIRVDNSAVLWIPFRAGGRPGPNRDRTVFFLRVAPSGVVLDTVPVPPVPKVERHEIVVTSSTPHGGIRMQGVSIPYQPVGLWAWDPQGTFTVLRTDQYRIAYQVPGDSRTVTRNLAPVPIDEAERRVIAARMREERDRIEGGDRLHLPEPPKQKPILKGIEFALDGRLIVHVATPSIFRAGEWRENPVFDVFDKNGKFEGRVALTDASVVWLLRLRGDRLWVVHEGDDEVMSVRQYRVIWSSRRSTP